MHDTQQITPHSPITITSHTGTIKLRQCGRTLRGVQTKNGDFIVAIELQPTDTYVKQRTKSTAINTILNIPDDESAVDSPDPAHPLTHAFYPLRTVLSHVVLGDPLPMPDLNAPILDPLLIRALTAEEYDLFVKLMLGYSPTNDDRPLLGAILPLLKDSKYTLHRKPDTLSAAIAALLPLIHKAKTMKLTLRNVFDDEDENEDAHKTLPIAFAAAIDPVALANIRASINEARESPVNIAITLDGIAARLDAIKRELCSLFETHTMQNLTDSARDELRDPLKNVKRAYMSIAHAIQEVAFSLPKTRKTVKWPWSKMEVGETATITDDLQKARTALAMYSMRTGRKFRVLKLAVDKIEVTRIK